MSDNILNTTILGLTFSIKELFDNVAVPSILDDADKESVQLAIKMVSSENPSSDKKHVYSVFNSLNGNSDNKFYSVRHLIRDDMINYPMDKDPDDDDGLIEFATQKINEALSGITLTDTWINDYLELLENVSTFLPSVSGENDISLFDQAKLCAALATCISLVKKQRDIVSNDEDDLFLLYSMDFSGIQDFIYTINSKGALKMLRAKSFYLEILMENIIDDLLVKLGLTRVNLIYSGGGHCYLVLPNTEYVISTLQDYNRQINDWLLDMFDISLYVAQGFCKCSNNTLRNIPEGSYSELFRTISRNISSQKTNRYSFEQIKRLNSRVFADYSRECSICKRVDRLNSDNECEVCSSIKNFSRNILKEDEFEIREGIDKGLPLPFGRILQPSEAGSEGKLIRAYHKRRKEIPGTDSTPLWVGDYSSERNTLEEMAEDSKVAGRIERIGVVRADVDNLGTAFSTGFAHSNLLKTAALSRQLSLFFKHHINIILRKEKRNATICYSGGDDLFIVGEWYDVVKLSMDIRNSFSRYTQGTLSISAGIGIYDCNYPIKRIAYETADMEELSKQIPGKDSITIFEDNTYKWSDFEKKVIGEKLQVIRIFFDGSNDRGMSFLFKLQELIRERQEKINFARFVYLLSRLEPGKKEDNVKKEGYKVFSEYMYKWIRSEEDSKQLCTAIMLYAYLSRNKEGNNNGISE